MKIPFVINYMFYFIKHNIIKTITCILIVVTAPYLNSLEDTIHEDKINYQYQKDGKYFFIIEKIKNNEITYDVKNFDKLPKIENGKLIHNSYNELNILIWFVFVILCVFPIVGIFISDDDINFQLDLVFQATVSCYITCELEEDIYYYFYKDRFLGKSDNPLNREYRYIGRAFRIYNMNTLKSYPIWKTKTQRRLDKLEKIGV